MRQPEIDASESPKSFMNLKILRDFSPSRVGFFNNYIIDLANNKPHTGIIDPANCKKKEEDACADYTLLELLDMPSATLSSKMFVLIELDTKEMASSHIQQLQYV